MLNTIQFLLSLLTTKIIVGVIIITIIATYLTEKKGNKEYTSLVGCLPVLVLAMFIFVTYTFFDKKVYIVDTVETETATDTINSYVKYQHTNTSCPVMQAAKKVKCTIEMDAILCGRFSKCELCKIENQKDKEADKVNKERQERAQLLLSMKRDIHALTQEITLLQHFIDTLENGAELSYVTQEYELLRSDEYDDEEDYYESEFIDTY